MKKNLVKTSLVIISIIICIAVYAIVVINYQKNLEKASTENEQNVEISNEKLYTLENYPKVDASLATQPLANAFIKNFTGENEIDEEKLNYSNTHPGYVKLINDEVDLILVTEPSAEELQLAKEKGVELEVIPVVKEGFVFYVNSNNKVDNLTTEQIQKIYTNEIKNWKEVGGEDEKIVAYQRPVNSGSQTGMLSLVMKGLKLAEAPKENLIDTMQEIINLVSNYNNGKNSLGYSYYYYATTMFKTIDETVASNIKLLSVDGVAPNNENIKDSSYPFTTAYYIVINKADGEDSPARILANRMLSARGQKVAEEAGYVPVKENNESKVQNIESNVEVDETKKVAEDSKYAIKAYTETYDINSIKCTNYYDVNGKVTKELPNYDGNYINYIEIDGLKDTNIQAKINERLKQEAYKIKGYTSVTANFSNILSVQIWNDKEKIGINVNLATGEDIPFEKLFIQSTPINSLLADGLYEKLAWNELYNSGEAENGPIDVFDMKKADTSTYEDKFLMLIKKYNKLNGEVKYNFYANKVLVYDLIDENIIPNYEGYDNSLTIDLTKYPDQVAIFKRYLTENSIYENDNLGLKNVIVLTDSGLFDNYMDSISYGKIADNIFVEEVMLPQYETTDKEKEMFKKYCIDLSNIQKNKLKTDSNSNMGIFYQREYYLGKGDDILSDCYFIHVYSYQATCDISYFENLAFKDFIELKKIPRVQAGINAFMDYMKEDFPNLKILDYKDEQYYYDKNGNFIGNSEEEAKSKIKEENQDSQDNITNNTNNTNITYELDNKNTNINITSYLTEKTKINE